MSDAPDPLDLFEIITGIIIVLCLAVGAYIMIDAWIAWEPSSRLPIQRIFDAVRKELGGSE